MKCLGVLLAFVLGFSSAKAADPITVTTGVSIGAGVGYGVFKAVTSFFSVDRILSYAGKEVSIVTLQRVQAKNPEIARQVAKDTMMACQDATKYLQSGVLPTADIINQVLTSKFANIDPELLQVLQDAGSELGKSVPSADVFLTPQMIGHIIAFIGPDGMENGIMQWMTDNNVSVKIKYTKPQRREENTKKLKSKDAVGWFSPLALPNPGIKTVPAANPCPCPEASK